MLKIEGKTFMNIQEAVQWLLDNNALPFQSTANYAGNTEIGLGTIVNPTPAKVRIGSLIFFADSKVSTVIGLTENGFICSDQYNNLVDDIAYVTNVSINASGHLITSLSDGQTIDAGIVKQVTGFSINASQHLIVSYNDGTNTDLGAIFSGNITVSGNLTVTGGVSANAVTSNSIIENMSGYSFALNDIDENADLNVVYASVVKTGNKITFVWSFELKRTGTIGTLCRIGGFVIPSAIGTKLNTYTLGWSSSILDSKTISLYSDLTTKVDLTGHLFKSSNTYLEFALMDSNNLTANTTYIGRVEVTFLLSDSLAS